MNLLLTRDHEALACQIEEQLAQAFPVDFELTRCHSTDTRLNTLTPNHYNAILITATCRDTLLTASTNFSGNEFSAAPLLGVIENGANSDIAELKSQGIDDLLFESELTPTLLRRSLTSAIEHKSRQRAADEISNKTLKLLSRLSHEFNGHVRILRAASAILQEDIAARTPLMAGEKQWFDITSDRLYSIESSISDFTYLLGLSHHTLCNNRVNLNELLDDIGSTLSTPSGDGIHMNTAELPVVYGDKSLLGVLLMKALHNSTIYNHSDEVHVAITHRSTSENVDILIEDNGIGIESCYLDSIFEPFIRLHHDTEYSGSGLGLTIARTIAELHDGTTYVASEPSTGSRFTLSLPVCRLRR